MRRTQTICDAVRGVVATGTCGGKDLRRSLKLSRVEMTAVRSNELRVRGGLCAEGGLFTSAALAGGGVPTHHPVVSDLSLHRTPPAATEAAPLRHRPRATPNESEATVIVTSSTAASTPGREDPASCNSARPGDHVQADAGARAQGGRGHVQGGVPGEGGEEAEAIFKEIQRQVLRRTEAIDAVWQDVPAGATIVSVGAGFDMRAHRLGLAAERGVKHIEIDLPMVIEMKRQRLAGVAAGPNASADANTQQQKQQPQSIVDVTYTPLTLAKPVGADRLLPPGSVSPGDTVLWSAEGVLEYLTTPRRRAVFEEFHRASRRRRVDARLVCTLLLPTLFDAFPPSPYQRRKFGAWSLPLLSYEGYMSALADAGWDVTNSTHVTEHCAVVEARAV